MDIREKDELANAKLQQMVSGQNEAERRKGEAESISKDLEKRNKHIAERRHQVRPLTSPPSRALLRRILAEARWARCEYAGAGWRQTKRW